jgi:16S rRNA pseudouridine516 synthase
MRIDKWVAHATGLSRSQVRRAIRAGLVQVDGQIEKRADAMVGSMQQVSLDNQPLKLPIKRYLMLNKPVGVICAASDGHHPTINDLIDDQPSDGLHCAGRLDVDSTGLVLLTDDGQWSHAITAPRRHCEKRYRVEAELPLTPLFIEQFCTGVNLHGEERPTRPARLEQLSDHLCLVWLQEGRYHQIKRMFHALGNAVTALHREAIGALELDTGLEEGQYRSLTLEEINLFQPDHQHD